MALPLLKHTFSNQVQEDTKRLISVLCLCRTDLWLASWRQPHGRWPCFFPLRMLWFFLPEAQKGVIWKQSFPTLTFLMNILINPLLLSYDILTSPGSLAGQGETTSQYANS